MAKRKKGIKTNADTQQEEALEFQKPLNFIFPEGLTTRLSNWAAVQTDPEGYFTISFFEVRKPFLLAGSLEDKKQFMESLPSIPAICVARIALLPDHFKRLGDAIEKTSGKLKPKE